MVLLKSVEILLLHGGMVNMASKNMTPLGYVDLANGSKAIYPMNDIR